jgi:hypothetical protein
MRGTPGGVATFEAAVSGRTMLGRSDADRRAHVVVELAALTLLIDAKLATIEEAAQRIEQIQGKLLESYRAEDVSQRLKLITTWLRGHIRQPPGQWTPVVIEGGRDRDLPPDQGPQKS